MGGGSWRWAHPLPDPAPRNPTRITHTRARLDPFMARPPTIERPRGPESPPDPPSVYTGRQFVIPTGNTPGRLSPGLCWCGQAFPRFGRLIPSNQERFQPILSELDECRRNGSEVAFVPHTPVLCQPSERSRAPVRPPPIPLFTDIADAATRSRTLHLPGHPLQPAGPRRARTVVGAL